MVTTLWMHKQISFFCPSLHAWEQGHSTKHNQIQWISFKILSTFLSVSSPPSLPPFLPTPHTPHTHTHTATSNAASLYFTNFSSIQLLDDNLTTVVLGELEHAESCDVCSQTVFWVDMLGKIKKGVPNNQSSIEVVGLNCGL